MNKILHIFGIIIGFLFLSIYSHASAAEALKVGTIEREPFSYQDASGQWTGFAIDLWKDISKKNNLEYEFVEYESFQKMIQDTQNKTNDLSVANISITTEREKVLDFSSPIYDSGLNIAELSDNSAVFSFYAKYSHNVFLGIKILLGILFILTHYFFILNVIKGYIAFWSYPWEIFSVLMEVLRQIKENLGAKILFPTSLIIGVFVVAFISQKFSFVLNDIDQQQLNSQNLISYNDISENTVGTTNGSVGKSFLEKKGVSVTGYNTLEDVYNGVVEKEIDYIVADDPILRYKVKNDPRFQVVGKVFNKDKYAIVFPEYKNGENASLVKKINISLLQMQEDGRYDTLYQEYFE